VDEDLLPLQDHTNGWGGLFKQGLEVIQMEGDHISIIGDEQNAIAVGRQINAVLDRYVDDAAKCEGRLLGRIDERNGNLCADQSLDSRIRHSQKTPAQ